MPARLMSGQRGRSTHRHFVRLTASWQFRSLFAWTATSLAGCLPGPKQSVKQLSKHPYSSSSLFFSISTFSFGLCFLCCCCRCGSVRWSWRVGCLGLCSSKVSNFMKTDTATAAAAAAAAITATRVSCWSYAMHSTATETPSLAHSLYFGLRDRLIRHQIDACPRVAGVSRGISRVFEIVSSTPDTPQR